VDFQSLREKYKNIGKGSGDAAVAQTEEDREKIRKDYEKLAESTQGVHTCEVCYGSGIERYSYNFQVREMNCTRCGGDGIIIKKNLAPNEANEELVCQSQESNANADENEEPPSIF
jgi:DnaJ-class molecular chaperone